MSQARPGLAGLVIAGGRSNRFGAEKAVQILNGRSLLEWAASALAGVCADVAVSARADSGAAGIAARLGLPLLTDDPAHPQGPLAGVAAGLAWAAARGASGLVTLACDTPGVTAAMLRRLVEAGPAAHAATADGFQGLCALWPVSALPDLKAALDEGRHPSVRAALAAAGAAPVLFDDAEAFANLNSPEDLARLRGR
ncbi:MAG TPA: molybdenum cofactor guanylyltransferase [Caulobacteraceae bacterium]|nr:molybdenum cofactor guanylyltransferase [Caulobacteraceae bacterium]